jgi:hypothetical protein
MASQMCTEMSTGVLTEALVIETKEWTQEGLAKEIRGAGCIGACI